MSSIHSVGLDLWNTIEQFAEQSVHLLRRSPREAGQVNLAELGLGFSPFRDCGGPIPPVCLDQIPDDALPFFVDFTQSQLRVRISSGGKFSQDLQQLRALAKCRFALGVFQLRMTTALQKPA
jgi:hypothetical protein